MLAFFIAGLALGGTYAISTIAIVFTYNASKVFNFAQGAMAFFVAYCFHYFVTNLRWAPWPAASVCLLVISPTLGVGLWAALLGRLAERTQIIRIACMIGLQVAITSLTLLIFGQGLVYGVRGLVSQTALFHLGGVAVGDDQVLVIGAAVLVAAIGLVVLHRTPAGLIVRGNVDSPLMAVLVGTNTRLVQACTWAVGAMLAGLAGILIAPTASLDPTAFANLLVASFAGAIIGRLTNLWLAFLGAVFVGVAQSMVTPYLPATGLLSTALRPSMPFLFMVVAVLVSVRSHHVRDQLQTRDTAKVLGRAEQQLARSAELLRSTEGSWDRYVGWGVLVAVAVLVPIVVSSYWVGEIGLGLTFAVVFLSYRLITGEGGVAGLCQITFAGIGGCVTAQFASVAGFPFFPSVLLAAAIAALCGLVVGLICLPLGQLYGAITTFALALLADNTIFNWNRFSQLGTGVPLNAPSIGSWSFAGTRSFYWLMVVVFAAIVLYLIRVRRSRSGLAFAVARVSRNRALTLGVNVFGARLALFGAGAAVAAIGGGLFAASQDVAVPTSFAAELGLVWFAVAMAQGPSSIGGLAVAGISLGVGPALFSRYLPASLGEVLPVLFGLAAVALVNNPNGVNLKARTQVRMLAIWAERSLRPSAGPPSGGGVELSTPVALRGDGR